MAFLKRLLALLKMTSKSDDEDITLDVSGWLAWILMKIGVLV